MLEPANRVRSRVWGPWATTGFGLGIGIVFLLTQLMVASVFVALRLFFNPEPGLYQINENFNSNGLFLSLCTFATTIVCVGLIILIIKLRRGASISEYLALRAITGKTILVLLAVTVGLIIVTDALTFIFNKSDIPQFMIDAYRTSTWPVIFWVALIFLAPLFEETFFRGFLFEGLRQSRIGNSGTICLTALIWSLIHFQYDMYAMTTIFALGIVLGTVRLKTGSLWGPCLMHAFWNLAAMIGTALYVHGTAEY